jgi:hypothetical protein
MSADLLAQLAKLPPGTDIFPIVRGALNAEVGSSILHMFSGHA